jgi:nucleoside-diphosphate-sugar epimerase
MPTAFVTGGTGFLGSNLVGLLKEQGWRVIAMHRRTTNPDRLTALGAEPRIAELDDVESLKRAMPDGVDAVFHVAASISWWRFDREQQERVNVGGTRCVAEAALARGAKRFVHTSSVAAYGIQQTSIDERTPSTAGDSPFGYVRTKWLAEQEVRKAIEKGLAAIIVNPTNIMGPYDRTGWARLFRMLKEGKLPGVPPGSGSWCHSLEVARAHLAAVTQGKVGENYLLGGTDCTYAELATMMAELLGVKPPRPLPGAVLKAVGTCNEWLSIFSRKEPDMTYGSAFVVCSSWRVDTSKAVRELGYVPRSLREMIEDSYRWQKDAGLI